jgi:hypothetical protein
VVTERGTVTVRKAGTDTDQPEKPEKPEKPEDPEKAET